MTKAEELMGLASKVARGRKCDNALDVLVEIALFEPCKSFASVRANAAGTKVIYTDVEGDEATFWPRDYTHPVNRKHTAAALRARAAIGGGA